MDSESRFRSIQLRAYEIYRERDPAAGTAEEDWCKAEAEIKAKRSSEILGPARLKDKSLWGCVTTHEGEDLENPS